MLAYFAAMSRSRTGLTVTVWSAWDASANRPVLEEGTPVCHQLCAAAERGARAFLIQHLAVDY